MKYLTLIFVLFFLSSCSNMVPEPDLHLRLKGQKQTINSIISNGEVLPHSVAALNKDQEIDSFYQLYQNGENNLLKVSETHLRDSEPSDTTLVYYFDKYENLFAFQVKVTLSNDSLYNSATAFYDNYMEIVSQEYATIDNCDTPMDGTDTLSVDFTKYHLPTDVKTFAKEKKIILRNR